mgnify:CR=1 FL=1
MDRKTLLLPFLTLLAFMSSKAGIVEKTYHFSEPKLKSHGEYQTIHFKNTLLTAPIGEPALPYHKISLILPPGHVAKSVSFEGTGLTKIAEPFNCYPRQPNRPLSEEGKGAFQKSQAVYSSSATYPAKNHGRFSTSFMKGHSVVLSTFTPAKYNPAEQALSWYKSVTIRVKTQPAPEAQKALRFLPSLSKTRDVLKVADNPQALQQYSHKSRSDNAYNYLIIADAAYQDSFDSLMTFYQDRGLKSQVATTQQISGAMEGQDLQEKMRNYIIQEYEDHQIDHVLLAGDVEYIPYRGFYCTVESSSTYEDDDIPSDIYYSSLDGSWNEDGDNLWGEPDEDDLLPEVAVARLPFSSQQELDKMLNKTMSFQASPIEGELEDPFLAGEHLYDNPETWGSDYLELHIGYHDDNDYETQGIPEDYDIEKLYASEQGSWSGDDLMDYVNEGKSLLYHVGHANATMVMGLYISDVTNENFSGANGVDHNFTNVYTHGCICGSFDNDDCIGEEMVKIDNFAASFIGNSRYGWFNEGQTEGPSQHIHREFTDALFGSENLRIGAAHMESKAQTAPWVEAPGQWEEGAQRWCFYDCNVLGESAMQLWTSEPLEVATDYPESFQIGEEHVSVTVSLDSDPLQGYHCVIKQNGNYIGHDTTGADGIAQVPINSELLEIGEAKLMVSGENMLLQQHTLNVEYDDEAFLLLEEYTIDDENGNGTAENGEAIALDVTMQNAGLQDAENVMLNLSTDDEFITITDSEESIGVVEGQSFVTAEDAFTFDVLDGIPDQHMVTFTLTATSGESWSSEIEMVVNAPALEIIAYTIDDDEQGNGNGYIDPGETVSMVIENANNGHNGIADLTGQLTSSSSYISIPTNVQAVDEIADGETVTTSYELIIDDAAPLGEIAEFQYELSGEYYSAEKSMTTTMGMIVEDFETGDFSGMEWETNSGDIPWEICEEDPYEGQFCSVSGSIGGSESSILQLQINVQQDDSISFSRKVSSEENYDYLRFYIDSEMIGEWSGQQDWEQFSYPIPSGSHTVKWAYEKDYAVSNYQDCGWIDEIVFPPVAIPTQVEYAAAEYTQMHVYPNPVEQTLHVNVPEGVQNGQIVITDRAGRAVKVIGISGSETTLKSINVQELPRGLYLISLTGEGEPAQAKFIKE